MESESAYGLAKEYVVWFSSKQPRCRARLYFLTVCSMKSAAWARPYLLWARFIVFLVTVWPGQVRTVASHKGTLLWPSLSLAVHQRHYCCPYSACVIHGLRRPLDQLDQCPSFVQDGLLLLMITL